MLIALAKLSFGGGGATTWNGVGEEVPPPGGGFTMAMSLVLPNGPSRLAGIVARRQAGRAQAEVGVKTLIPAADLLNVTWELAVKPFPLNVSVTGFAGVGVCTGVEQEEAGGAAGVPLVQLRTNGMPPRTVKVIAFDVAAGGPGLVTVT